uniref:(California timema) hypothetical protein n=1 Tax=Timema californicum TaxID=61474 RepID=A0A7R9J0Q6_TIMCA|nr:unnamed protein product [Timema californicum]
MLDVLSSTAEDGEIEVQISIGSPLEFVGRYTRDIHDYELVVPQKVNEDGSFLTYSLPYFYERFSGDRRKRQPDIKVHYALHFNGDLHHIELEPNYDLLSPAMVVESKRNDIRNSKFTSPKSQQCHFIGTIRGHRNSRAAISLCEGMAGYLKTETGDLYFIEPAKDSEPERDGRHHHLIYRQLADNPWGDSATVEGKSVCGVKDS